MRNLVSELSRTFRLLALYYNSTVYEIDLTPKMFDWATKLGNSVDQCTILVVQSCLHE
jgi:hypothetical protein